MKEQKNLIRKERYLSVIDQLLLKLEEELDYPQLKDYVTDLKQQFITLEMSVTHDNIWLTLSKLIGVDTKIRLIRQLCSLKKEECDEEMILLLVESDFIMYHQELLAMDGNRYFEDSFLSEID